MILNFIKITFRNFWKNRGYSFLNIFGLAIGIACAGLIFLWVEDELSYDQFANKDRVYHIQENQTYEGKVRTFGSSPGLLAPALTKEVPGIEAASRSEHRKPTFSLNEKALAEDGSFTDASYFGIFNISFAEGNAASAFDQLTNIVISQKMAKQFFGAEPAVGKTLKMNNHKDYRVAGVFRDLPENFSDRLEWMAPYADFYNDHKQGGGLDNWYSNSMDTYVQLKPGVNPATVNKQLYGFIQTKKTDAIAHCFLFSANDWHLRAQFEDGKQVGGRIEYVRLFVIIAWIILFIACINFMNLATARSDKRAKEVGVRKVLGAYRKGLIGQFIGEAMVLSFLAVLTGVLLIALLLPAFSLLIGKPLNLHLGSPLHIGVLLAIMLVCGLVAGSYPALYLSSFNPIYVFKGIRMKGTGASYIRKGLVVAQFTVSVVLIISTIIIYRQIEHIHNRNIGYNRENLVTVSARGETAKNIKRIRQDLINTGSIENVALNSFNTFWIGNNGSGAKWAGQAPGQDPLISFRSVTPGFFATAGMQLAEGRDFRADLPEADSMHVLVTESLAKMMGKGSALGKKIWFGSNDSNALTVVGIVKDFVFGDMYGKPEPVLFSYGTDEAMFMYVRIKAGARPETAVAQIESVLKKDNPGYPVEYSFVSDDFDAMFKSEALMGQLSRLFAALAIIISCLGLFGLSAYMAERRIKEIGIRKVLGASVSGLTGLLSKEFLQLVGLSVLIAFPLAGWAMNQWLHQFAYRIGMEWWIFVVAGLAALAIALLTVSFQAIRAASLNPVKSLRSE
jgi:putative ABC transport system permease protein